MEEGLFLKKQRLEQPGGSRVGYERRCLTKLIYFSSLRSLLMRAILILFYFLLGIAAEVSAADSGTNVVRELTLEECVQLALEHNLDIRIQKYNPQIDRFNLEGVYGDYDPQLQLEARRSFNSSEGSRNAATFNAPANETDGNLFSAGLTGLVPTGLTYDLGGSLTRNDSSVFRIGRSGFGSNVVSKEYRTSPGINLRQPLLKNFWIDSTRYNIQIAKRNLKISETALTLQIMRTITSVEEAYYDLILAREKVKVQEKALQLSQKLLAENKKRVEVGALAPLDEKQAESELAKSRADLLTVLQTLSAQQNLLKNLISDNFSAWHDTTIAPAEKLEALPQRFNLQESWRIGLEERPELQRLKLDLERRDIRLKFLRNQLFPALDLIGSYGYNGLDEFFGGVVEDISSRRNPFYSYGVVVTIPLGNRRARGNYKVSKAEKAQALVEYKKQEQTILVEIEDAIAKVYNYYERVGATKEARAYAELALEAEQKKLENGKSTSFQVLQLQRDLTARRSEEIQAYTDYNKALAEVALKEGTTLDRNRIKLEIK